MSLSMHTKPRVKNNVKTLCCQLSVETVKSCCRSQFMWKSVQCCWSGVRKRTFTEFRS